MKKSKEIVGLPVISISEGLEIGEVKGLFINPKEKNIEFFLLDEKGFSSELKGIPFLSAEAIGDFAVIVDTKCGIIDIMKVGILRETYNLDVDIIGIKVITTKGRYLGDVTEYSVDAGKGAIQSFYFQSKTDNTEYIIPASSVITIGKEALIIEDKEKGSKEESAKNVAPVAPAEPKKPKPEPEETVKPPVDHFKPPFQPEVEPVKAPEPEPVNLPEQPKEAIKAPPSPRINDIISEYQKQDQLKDERDEPAAVSEEKTPAEPPQPAFAPVQPAPAPAAPAKPKSEDKVTVNKLVEQQKQYVLGKTLIRDIKDDKGEVIAKENEVVTEDIFMNLYKAGPNKVVEAMTYVKD